MQHSDSILYPVSVVKIIFNCCLSETSPRNENLCTKFILTISRLSIYINSYIYKFILNKFYLNCLGRPQSANKLDIYSQLMTF